MKRVEHVQAKKNNVMDKDPNGFFVILIDRTKGVIRAELYKQKISDVLVPNMKAELVGVVEGRTAEEVRHTICRLGMVSRLDHAAYLGDELRKAEIALKHGLDYIQDKELRLES